jgi:anti-sigma factor ChrR (cupin superfamily)
MVSSRQAILNARPEAITENDMTSATHRDIFAAAMEWRQGTSPGIEFARFSTDAENPKAPSIILSRFAPGEIVPPHTHASNYFEYIIEGEQTVGKTRFGRGDVRIVKGGAGYGPIRVGAQGCTVLIVFEDASRAMMESLPRKHAATDGQDRRQGVF